MGLSECGLQYQNEKVPADSTHKDFQILEFNIRLPANQYVNWNSAHICLPIQIKNKITPAKDIDATMITTNNFFSIIG